MKKIFLHWYLFVYYYRDVLKQNSSTETKTEEVSADYGKVIEIAKDEFYSVFSEFDDLEINETTTMARSNDENHVVIQFKYESGNGSGIYGFEYQKDGYGNYELLQQGEEVTIDNLVK